MNNKIKTVVRIMLLVVMAAVVGVGVYSINAERLTGNALPMPFGFGSAVVLSGSMEPERSVGDLLLVVPSEAYEVEQVVVYQDGRTLVVHRILRFEGDNVVTMGDANDTEDDPILLTQIKGKVVFAIPLVGHVVNLLKSPIGIIAVLVLAIWLMERSFRKEKDNKQEQLRQIRAEIERLKNDNKQN